jgi:WD repeat-containing protein 35
MVNNRQKSIVTSMKWSNDGLRIAITYEDGQIIVGSVDGNRIWHKDLGVETIRIAVCWNYYCYIYCWLKWNPDDTILVIGFITGEVQAYDQLAFFSFFYFVFY